MEIEGGDYESCKNMIWKLSLDRFNLMKDKRPDVEFDDVLSEAFCIYAQCLKTYKGNKNTKFTTFLFTNLKARLRDFYFYSQKQIYHYEDYNFVDKDGSVKSYEDNIVSPDYNYAKEQMFELYKKAKEELSYEAYQTFKYIVERKWEVGNKRVFPTNIKLAKAMGYSIQIMDSIMFEIRLFWQQKGCYVA